MPSVRRRAARGRKGYTAAHLEFLGSGWDYFHCGWGDAARPNDMPADEREAQIAECWELHQDEVLARHVERFPCARPWGWWRYSAPAPRDKTIHEPEQLHRWSLLLATEIAAIRQHDLHGNRVFRRRWSWWLDRGGRDYGTSEVQQLIDLDALDDWERRCLADGPSLADLIRRDVTCLTQAEAAILRLPPPKFGSDAERHTFD